MIARNPVFFTESGVLFYKERNSERYVACPLFPMTYRKKPVYSTQTMA